MKRYYLTNTLSEEDEVKPWKLAPDIAQKMQSHRRVRSEYKTTPPPIRPHPLSKYSSSGAGTEEQEVETIYQNVRDRQIEKLDEEEEEAEAGEEEVGEEEAKRILEETMEMSGNDNISMEAIEWAAQNLPIHAQRRALRLMPYLVQVDIGDAAELPNILYDLTVPRVKKIRTRNLNLLRSVYNQLDTIRQLPSNLVIRKLAIDGLEREARQRQKQYQRRQVYTRPGFVNVPLVATDPSANLIMTEDRKLFRRSAPAYQSVPLRSEEEEEEMMLGANDNIIVDDEAPTTPQVYSTPKQAGLPMPTSSGSRYKTPTSSTRIKETPSPGLSVRHFTPVTRARSKNKADSKNPWL